MRRGKNNNYLLNFNYTVGVLDVSQHGNLQFPDVGYTLDFHRDTTEV